jgi:hypothetical protein
MGVFFLHSEGIDERNTKKAYMWLKLANIADGKGSVASVAAKMTPDQEIEALRLVAQWVPNPEECESFGTEAEK